MELLIVVAIIIVIITFALPKMHQPIIQTNETSAMNSLRTLREAETMYASRYPMQGYTCSMTALGPPPSGQQDTPQSADLIDPRLATGAKDGYTFTLQGCTTAGAGNTVVTYHITAVPLAPGQTGIRAFCTDNTGNNKYDPSGNAEACVSGNNIM